MVEPRLRLVVFTGPGEALRFPLGAEGTVGSGADADYRMEHPAVSRRHARLTLSGDGVTLEDLGSSNGTRVGGRRLSEPHLLVAGEEFSLGPLLAVVEPVAEGDLEAAVELPGATRSRISPVAEGTAELGALQTLIVESLPDLLGRVRRGTLPGAVAREAGAAWARAIPATRIEISRHERRGEEAVLFRHQVGDGESVGGERDVHLEDGDYRLEMSFAHPSHARLYRPLASILFALVALAERTPRRARESGGPRPHETPTEPSPPSSDPRVRRIYREAATVARGEISVVICGESGTGKEVLARFVHRASPRASGPWVALNCAALSRELLESELFGIERGVATGVDERPGKFEQAAGGTLMLDEIGDMALETQAKILRVLQEGEFYRIGGRTARRADVRIVAATNRDLGRMISEGSLRSDLYHRIADWEVELPPLRERRADVINLAAHFLAEAAEQRGIRVAGISRAAAQVLVGFDWPGNIRQLEREIARAVLFLGPGELLETRHLDAALKAASRPARERGGLKGRLAAYEREIVTTTLDHVGGDVDAACEELRISRSTLYRRLRDLGIERPE